MNFKSKNIKRIGVIILSIIILLIRTKTIYAEMTSNELQVMSNSPEFGEVNKFISIVIFTIRLVVVSICGLIAANAGIKVATEENADGSKEGKKAFEKIVWALFLVFAGTAIASILAKRVLNTMAGI
jgi:hypothetical protein